jgi:transposase-like protein
MSKSVLSAAHFHDEAAAFDWVEARVWPNGPVCPHCGGVERISKMAGKSTRLGTYKCYQCRKPFTVKVGTIFEASHVGMHLWLQAIFLMSSSKKGISSNQLHRTLGVTLKTAWFMSHRIREAMRDGVLTPMGGNGGIVEADETYYGNSKERKVSERREAEGRAYTKGGKRAYKRAIVALVERGGNVRSFHVENADKATVSRIVTENVARETRLHTDESRLYVGADQYFASHETVKHTAKEYVRGDIHTNSAEGFFSIFKRGMKGVYQHCGEKHLHRYLAEYDFRYNNRIALGTNDVMRAEQAVKGIVGKRLTYQTTRGG